MSKDAFDHLEVSQLDLPAGSSYVFCVYLSGDKLYSAVGKTLYVYLVSDITTHIATYSLIKGCFSAIISENRLYLGGSGYL